MSMSKQDIMAEVEIMTRARYPIIYLLSWEERRVEQLLLEMANQRNKKIFTWSITQGVVSLGGTGAPSSFMNEGTRDPLAALDHIQRASDSALYVLKDFHPYMNDPTVVRKLRDLAGNLKTSFKTIFILSPTLKIPHELEKEISVVDFPLPSMQELGTLLDNIVRSIQGKSVQINLDQEGKERILQAALGLTLTEAESVFARTIVSQGRLDPADIAVILSEKKQIIRKSGILEYYAVEEGMQDIGGVSNLKDWLRKRAIAFTEKARDYGLPQPKGILMLGVSGSGKSLVAKAVSNYWGLPLLRFDIGAVFAGLVGESESNMRKAIRTAESIAPAVLWLDEIDKGLSGSYSSGFSDGGTTSRVLSNFLTWLQEKTSPVFVIATANDVSALPPELLRKGRLDELFFVDLPTGREREEIFAIHLQKRKRDPQHFDLKILGSMTNGFSGAEIEQVIISALYDSFEADRELMTPDMVNAIRQTVPLSHTMREHIDALRHWAQTRARPASGEQSVILPSL